MQRMVGILICGLGLLLAQPARAQFCSELPLCPETAATPQGFQHPQCSCPRPDSCDFKVFFTYACFFVIEQQVWSCECTDRIEPEERPDFTPEPFAPPGGFCAGLVCPDGSAPRPDAGSCLCPDPNGVLVQAAARPRAVANNSCLYPMREGAARRERRRSAGWRGVAKPNYCPVKLGLVHESARVTAE